MKHGHASNWGGKKCSPTYKSWVAMVQRCTKEYHTHYHRYKGKLPTCWETFEPFLEDMGERPLGTSLDRIDGTLGYSKGNCRWATSKEQQRNKCSNKLSVDDATTIRQLRIMYGSTLQQLSEAYNVSVSTIKNVVYRHDWA